MYYTKYENGVYFCNDIIIEKQKWAYMLTRTDIFTESSLSAVLLLYYQINHKGSCYDIEVKYHLKKQSFNGIITSLAKRICNELNLDITGVDGLPTYWIAIMQSGRNIHNENGKHFEWTLRPELVNALDDYLSEKPVRLLYDDILISQVEVPDGESEGKRVVYYTTQYERSTKNRDDAIELHGTKCMVCGFDFEETYGDIGRGYIEVHHQVPISQIEHEVIVNPAKDLVCLCANCHRMVHRKRNAIFSVGELKRMLKFD